MIRARMQTNKITSYVLPFLMIIVVFSLLQNKAFAADNVVAPKESFESGTFNGTSYLPVNGTITSDAQKIVSGKYSAYLSSQASEEWKEFSYTDQSKIKFEKNTTYSVTFSYKSLDMQPLDANRFFYFLARSTDNLEDKQFTTWNDASGGNGIKTMTFTTGNKANYYLIWGIHAGGALSVDDITIVKKISAQSESFEKGSFDQTNFLAGSGVITSDPAKIVNGQYSAYLSSLNSEDWKAFSYTDTNKVKFEKNTTYKVTFSYKTIDMVPTGSDRRFYFLARSTDNTDDKGWTAWSDASGNKGRKSITFTTGNKENYYLIWGIFKGGALSIDDIEITKVNESFESGSFTNTNFNAGSGVITNESSKVVTGQYSAYLKSLATEPTKEFVNTDLNKYKFEPNTTYSVTFSYKSADMDSSNANRYFYFLARSSDKLEEKGMTTWQNPSGSKGSKTVTFTTGSKDNYFLVWGICQGGALSLDDIEISKVSESFEGGSYSGTGFSPVSGMITNESSKTVSGSYSAYLSSTASQQWANFASTDLDQVKFQSNTTYSVTFSYKSIDMDSTNANRYFYFSARGLDDIETKGWTTWNSASGTKGVETVSFTTGNQENYYLFWGIYGGGALSIDDIIIKQATTYLYDDNGRLVQIKQPNNKIIYYNYDSNGNLKGTRTE
ncbi:RHS repeat domain-containing protein [Paenibacillus sp. FSL M7-1046]|uniref:RHS repeat domain-containing protein n=2 Tax=Paenibacillus TaxID=44249 RepID=UPI0030F6AF40